jgi:hypothetical protein
MTFHNREFWLEYGGSNWWSDSIGLFVMPPIVASGIFLNLVGFLMLHYGDVFQQSKIYVYLKFNFLNGFICNLTGMLYSFTVVRRFLPFANSYFALWYMNTIGLPIANVCYFYANILDLLIIFENLTIFIKSVDGFSKKRMASPNIICMALFMICLIIDLPYFFFYSPSQQLVNLSSNETYLFTNYEITEFTLSYAGQAILYFQYIVRDIFPLVFLVILSATLIIQLKRYLRKQKFIASRNNQHDVKEMTLGTIQTGNNVAEILSEIVVLRAEAKTRRSIINETLMVVVISFMDLLKNAIILISIVHSSIEQGVVGEFMLTLSSITLKKNFNFLFY